MLVHPLLFCLSEAYFLPLRARLRYWHQSLIAPDVDFPRVYSIFIPFRQTNVQDLYLVLMMHFFAGSRGAAVTALP